MYKEGIKRKTRLKAKKKKRELHVGVMDEQMGPKTPSMQKYIRPPNLSSLVSHDELRTPHPEASALPTVHRHHKPRESPSDNR